MILKVRKDFMVFKQRDFITKWFTVVDFHTLEAMFLLTTTAEKEAALSLFCELGISSQDQFCLQIEVNLRRKKGKEIFSTLTSIDAHLDRNRCNSLLTAFARSDKKLSHSRWVDRSK